jgi:hypothetical protein
MGEDKTFESLAAAIESDTSRVRADPSPGKKAIGILPYALLALATMTLVFGLRRDASELGAWVLWGLGAVQLLVAYGIFLLVVRDTIPGRAARPGIWLAALVAVVGAQLGVAYLTFGRSPLMVPSEREVAIGASCLARMTLVALPVLLLALVVASRGLPLRPRIIGLVSGFASGLVAEAVYRTHCPFSHTSHVLPWHGGAVALLGLIGFFAGAVWGLRQTRMWRRRRSS